MCADAALSERLRGVSHPMIDPRKAAYLEAMGIPVWVARQTLPEIEALQPAPTASPAAKPVAGPTAEKPESADADRPNAFRLCGQDDSGWLWLLGSPDEMQDDLFQDIVCAVLGSPSCLAGVISAAGEPVSRLVTERLLTRIVSFNADAGRQAAVAIKALDSHPVRLLRAPALDELRASPELKRRLWKELQHLRT